MVRSPTTRSSRPRRSRRGSGHSRHRSLREIAIATLRPRLMLEALEDRRMLAAASFLDDDAAWVPQGPAPILNGQGDAIPAERPVVGAIQAVVAHPTNPRIIWIGGTNGGIWRSESIAYANDGLDNDGINGVDDPNEIWTALYNQDSIDNDQDGTTDEADEVHWQPLTDDQDSLTTGDLVLDPTDATHNTLLVGIGRASSSAFRGGPNTGVLRITNASRPTALGGVTVDELTLGDGRNISGVAAGMTDGGDNVVLIAANSYGVNSASPSLAGVYQILKPGQPDEQVTLLSGMGNLPAGPAYDVIVDPADHTRFYVAIGGDAIAGTAGGLFRTDDGGVSWTNVGANNVSNPAFSPSTTPNGSITARTGLMEMAIHNSGGGNVLYVAVVNSPPGTSQNVLTAVFWTSDQGANWSAMDLPQTNEGGTAEGIHVGGQGNKHLSITADPTNPNLVYIGGDRQPQNGGSFPNTIGANSFTGRLFRGNRGVAANGAVVSPQWTHLTHSNTASMSALHADSRNLAFAADGSLIEVDDGGIYRRTNPANNTGDWFSLSGTLQISEVYSVAYDSNSHTIFAGSQDNGTSRQDGAGPNTVWRQFRGGDGGDVDVDVHTLRGSMRSIRYASAQNLSRFQRYVVNNNNGPVSDARLFPDDGAGNDILPFGLNPSFLTPVEVNQARPTDAQISGGQSTRVVVGGNVIIEANDAGTAVGSQAWTQVVTDPGFGGVNRAAMSYGGYKKGLAITGATNSSPIVITSNSHGLANGDQVEISDVLGNTAANGSFIVSMADANTFALVGTTGDGDYGSGGTWRQANPDALYVGSQNRVWVRSVAGGNLTQGGPITTAAGSAATTIRDVIVDPDDWAISYAVDESGRVYKSTDTGVSWNDVTGNLGSLLESGTRARSGIDANLWAAEVLQNVILPGMGRTPQNVPVVAGAYGVFYLSPETTPTGGLIWRKLGTGMPNSIVVDLEQGVDADGNAILVASTLGRGVFSMTLPQTLGLPELVDLFGPDGLNISVTGIRSSPTASSPSMLTATRCCLSRTKSVLRPMRLMGPAVHGCSTSMHVQVGSTRPIRFCRPATTWARAAKLC